MELRERAMNDDNEAGVGDDRKRSYPRGLGIRSGELYALDGGKYGAAWRRLGLGFGAVEQEASVGTFSLDILAQEVGTERAATEFARTRRRMVELAASGIPDCRVCWIADTIHDIGYHKPGELAAAIDGFLG